MKPRPWPQSFALIVLSLAAGLGCRYLRLGLPGFAVKYGGSLLWALLIYWILSTLLSSAPIVRMALISGGVATAIEFFKLIHTPGLDAFRLTPPGALLLGRFFSVWDLVAYWAASGMGALLDAHTRPAR